jgi:hypothetical protein
MRAAEMIPVKKAHNPANPGIPVLFHVHNMRKQNSTGLGSVREPRRPFVRNDCCPGTKAAKAFSFNSFMLVTADGLPRFTSKGVSGGVFVQFVQLLVSPGSTSRVRFQLKGLSCLCYRWSHKIRLAEAAHVADGDFVASRYFGVKTREVKSPMVYFWHLR